MGRSYNCPQCKENHTHFYLIKKLAQEVRKDARNGKVTWAADEWEEILDGSALFLEVKCAICGYTGKEHVFTERPQSHSPSK